MYRILAKQDELERVIVPVLQRNGSEIPAPNTYVAVVELDEAGEVLAYQLLQNAIFLEGLWARDGSAHLLTIHRMAMKYLEKLGVSGALTMTRQDETGERIGRIAKALGFEQMPWNVFRRKACH